MLLDECAGVDCRFGVRVTDVSRATAFRVETEAGGLEAPALVLATGGLSIPKLGASGFSHELAVRFGLPLTAIRPGLVPLAFAGEDLELMRPLAGVALPVRRGPAGRRSRRPCCSRTGGCRGPAILQASSYLAPGAGVQVDLLPGVDAAAALLEGKRRRPKAEARTVLAELLPQRLAAALAVRLQPAPMAEQRDQALRALGAMLNAWRLQPSGTEGYAKAEVTLGGIDTRALSSQTMEALGVPGLFAVGKRSM